MHPESEEGTFSDPDLFSVVRKVRYFGYAAR